MKNEGRPESGTLTAASGDSGSALDLLDLRDEETFRINDVIISYSGAGSTEASVELYDEPAGTGAGSLNDLVETVEIGPGERHIATEIERRDIEDDIVILPSNNDDDISVTVGGMVVTG